MADQKLTQLTALATLSADDLFYVVDDPAGAALSRKMTASVLDSRYLLPANNLSDLANAATARGNLGLGTLAVLNSPLPIANGGSGQVAQQAAIDALTAVSGATNEHVLTKDTASGNAIFKAAPATGAPVSATYITQTPDGTLTNEQALSALATGLLKNTTTTGVLSIAAQGVDYYAPGGTDVAIVDGGTGQSTAQAAIDALTNVAAATDEYVLTKDTATGNAIFKASGSGTTLPVADTQTIVKGSADATKLLRFEVDGFTAGATRVMTPPNQDTLLAGQNFANVFTALQSFSGTDHAGIKLNSLTTPQRDLLSASAGMLIYNSTSAEFQAYSAAWGPIPVLPITDTASLLYKSGSPSFTAKFSLTNLTTARTFTLPNLDGTLLTTVWLNDVNANVHVLEGLYGVYIDQAPSAGGLVLQGASAANTLKVVFKESGSEVASFEWDNFLTQLAFRGIKANSAVRFSSNNTDRMYISGGGFIGIGTGTTTPRGQLDVKQPSTTAAIPVMTLEQLDLSEEFFDFVGTVATGNPIEAIGAKTLTTTHFIRVAVNGSFLYIPVGTIA